MTARQPGPRGRGGAALVVVMILVLSLTVIVGVFAYAMKVETRLSHRTASTPELEWLARSGVEYAKWVLDTQRRVPGQAGFDALNQFWAGGPGDPDNIDDPFIGLSLDDVPIGDGTVSIHIIDAERKLNINNLNPVQLDIVFQAIGIGGADAAILADAIRDWRDRDDLDAGPVAAESGTYYLAQDPPYRAKNGPIDDISELLKIRGVDPGIYWGGAPTVEAANSAGDAGLKGVLCAISNGRVNVNTAPEAVLQVLFDGNAAAARLLLERRQGGDGMDGTFDDAPFRTPGEAAALLAGGNSVMTGLITTQSSTFEIAVRARWGGVTRAYRAVIRRGANRQQETLLFHPD